MHHKELTSMRIVKTSIFVDFLDIVFNLIVSLITGSVVMLAEMLEGIADFSSAFFVYIGLKTSVKERDVNHSFGYGKSLYFWVLVSGMIMILFTTSLTIYLGFERFLNPKIISNLPIACVTLTVFIFTNGYSLSLSVKRLSHGLGLKRVFKDFKSYGMIDTKTTFILDLIGTLSAFIGLVSLLFYGVSSNSFFDGLGAVIIGLFLGAMTLFVLKESHELIIGISAPKKLQNKIIKLVEKVPGIVRVLDLKTMNVGIGKFLVIIEIQALPNLMTKDIELLNDKIKEKVKDDISEVLYVQVELETPRLGAKKFFLR